MFRYFNHSMRIHFSAQYPFLILFFLFIFYSNLNAGITGKISGRIIDQSTGDPLPGANIILEGTNLGASSDLNGKYYIINIPPGKYTLVVRYIGYAKFTVKNISVIADRTTIQDAALNPKALKGKEVVVEAKRPVIQKDRTQSASVVNAETVKLMPVTEVKEVVELQAGVVDIGGALHFRGGRSREISYIIDGIPVNNNYSQGGGSNVAIENSMIKELEVISGTFNAEYGQAQSGIINVITKRPAKHYSGNLQIYSGDWLSNRDDIFLGVNNFNPLSEKDIQISLTGPLFSDKIGFFVTGRYNNSQSLEWYERRYMPYDGWRIEAYREWFRKYKVMDLSTSQAIPIPDSLRTGDFSRGPLAIGSRSDFSAKLSFYPRPGMSLIYQSFGFFNKQKGNTSRAFRYQPDGRGISRGWGITHNLHFHHMPWKNFFYNLAFSYQYNKGESYYRKDNRQAIVPGEPGIQLISASADGFSLGSTDWFYAGKNGKNYRKKYQLNGNINWQIDRYNFVKAGFILIRHNINVYSHGYRSTQEWANNQFPVSYQIEDSLTQKSRNPTFNEYWNYLDNVWWKNWEQTFKTTPYITVPDSEIALWSDYNIKPTEAAFYVQDKLELGELILNTGLRLDIFKANAKYPVQLRTEATNLYSDQNLAEASTKIQLSPRIGLSFPISDRGAFHASYGHFFQMPSFQYMFNGQIRPMTRITLNGRLLGNANLKPEKTIAYEIGLQQGITQTIALDITAYYKDFRNLLGIEQVATIDAVQYTHFINRDYGTDKGISVSISTSGAGMISGGINYTLSFANGSSSDPRELRLIQTATRIGGKAETFIDRKILPLNWDQRHTLNAYVNFNKPKNWSIGFVGSIMSGTPYSPTFIERFDIMAREYKNAAYKPVRWNVDLKAKKYLHFGGLNTAIFLKVDNIFNHLNQNFVHSSTGRADEIARLPEVENLLIERLRQEGQFTLHEVDVRPEYFSKPRRVQLGLEVLF